MRLRQRLFVGCRALLILTQLHPVVAKGDSEMRLSESGIKALKVLEGFRPSLYGKSYIGYGCFIRPREVARYKNVSLTESQGTALLLQRVRPIEAFITTHVVVPLNQNQFDALVSLVYSIGLGTFGRSNVLRLLNQGNYKEAAGHFSLYVKRRGELMEGLIARRKDEVRLFKTL